MVSSCPETLRQRFLVPIPSLRPLSLCPKTKSVRTFCLYRGADRFASVEVRCRTMHMIRSRTICLVRFGIGPPSVVEARSAGCTGARCDSFVGWSVRLVYALCPIFATYFISSLSLWLTTGVGVRGDWIARRRRFRVISRHRFAGHATDATLGVRETVVRCENPFPVEGLALPCAHPFRSRSTSTATSARPASPSSRGGRVDFLPCSGRRKRRSRVGCRLRGRSWSQLPKRRCWDRRQPSSP